MEEMEKLFNRPIFEKLFRFRKEYFEQKVYDNNEEIIEIGNEIVDAQDKMINFVKEILGEDKEKLETFEKLYRNVELTSSKEIYFWSLQYYKLGITEFTKMKQEFSKEKYAKYLDEKEIQEPINELMEDFFDDILEELENEKAKKLFKTSKYKEISKKYNEISKKYPNAVLAFEDSKVGPLTKEEVQGLIKLIEQEKETSLDETKLAVLLGIKIGVSL